VEFPAADFVDGKPVGVQAEGASVPSFSLAARAVAPIDVDMAGDTNNVVLVNGKDNEIRWTAVAGGEVEVLFNAGWHGAPPEATLYCEADDAEGKIVIPQAMVEAFPVTSDIGLEPHMSWIARITRDRVNLPQGKAELVVATKRIVYPIHE
jgi:hypothetical protein